MRDQVARLVIELQADHARVRTPAIALEVNGEDRKYLNPDLPIWSELPGLCNQLSEAIKVMRQHASTLMFVSTGMLERKAMSCEIALIECETALSEVSPLVRGESPWEDDTKWEEFEAAMKKLTTASARLAETHLAIKAEARSVVKAPWKPTPRMRVRLLRLRVKKLMARVWQPTR